MPENLMEYIPCWRIELLPIDLSLKHMDTHTRLGLSDCSLKHYKDIEYGLQLLKNRLEKGSQWSKRESKK